MKLRYVLTAAIALLLSESHPSLGQISTMGGAGSLFVENRGQWPRPAHYMLRTAGVTVWVTDDALLLDHVMAIDGRRQGHVVRCRFDGARENWNAQGDGAATFMTNWLTPHGNHSARGFAQVVVPELYPGIDMRLLTDDGTPRYDFVVKAGVDPAAIRMRIDGAQGLRIDKLGDLRVGSTIGEIRQGRLRAWQVIEGRKRYVPCSFELRRDRTVGFRLGRLDHRYPLVIDPLVYSSYLGGTADDVATGVAADGAGNAWVVGSTLSVNFPTLVGGYNTFFPSARTVFVTKINTSRGGLPVYSTFIGPGAAAGVAVDAAGNAYVAATGDVGYPVTQGAYTNTPTGQDVYVSKLSADGTALLYSARVGGGTVSGIALDGTRPVITGYTLGGFPSTINAFDTALTPGGPDAFVTKLSVNGTSLSYSTYLGGSGFDKALDVAVNSSGEAFVVGSTTSRDFPTTAGALQRTFDTTAEDGFVVRLGRNGDTLVYGTFLGGTGLDFLSAVDIDDSNDAYVAGYTLAGNFPTTASAFRRTPYDTSDAVVARLASSGSTLVYSTYLGGVGYDAANGIAVTSARQATVVGLTGSVNFSKSTSRLQGTYGGGFSDGFITRLNASGSALVHSTYLGGSGADALHDVAIGQRSDAVVAGASNSTNHPLTSNATQSTNGGGTNDAIVARLAVLEILHPAGGTELCAGSLDSITWNGSTDVTYDLFLSNDQGRTFSQLALAVSGTSYPWLIPGNIRPDTTYRLRIVTTGGSETDTVDSDITINARPRVTASPSDRVEPAGGTAHFTAQATGSPVPSVQWQVDSGRGWSNLPGATSRTLDLSFLLTSQNGFRYRALFRNDCGVDSTTAARLTVTGLAMTAPVGGEIFCDGDTIDIEWVAIGTNGPYRLEYSVVSGSGWTAIDTNVLGTTYRWPIPAGLIGTQFRLRVFLPPGFTIGSTDTDFTIHARPSVTRGPVDQVLDEGNTIELVAEANGFPRPDVMWEVHDGTGWVAVEGALFPSLRIFDVDTSMNGWRYRAVFTNDCGSDTTREALITVLADTSTTGVDGADHTAGRLRLTVTPNPARDRIGVYFATTSAGTIHLSLTDILGNPVIPTRSIPHGGGDGSATIDTRHLPSGLYICVIEQRGATRMKKVVVR